MPDWLPQNLALQRDRRLPPRVAPAAAALVAQLLAAREITPADALAAADLARYANDPGPAWRALVLLLLRERRRGGVALDVDPASLGRAFFALFGGGDGNDDEGNEEADPAAVVARVPADEAFPLRSRAQCDALARDAREALAAGRWRGAVARVDRRVASDDRPLVWLDAPDGSRLYLQRAYAFERRLESALRARLAAPPPPDQAADSAALAPLRAAWAASGEGASAAPRRGFRPGEEQQAALLLAWREARRPGGGFAVLTGGPGTGKTTVVAEYLRGLVRLGFDPARVALAAPTGRAAGRLSEAVQAAWDAHGDNPSVRWGARTLHRLLGYRPALGRYAHDATFPLPVDALVVDEVSMVDAVQLALVMEAVPFSAPVLLVGDPRQLPSVAPGRVLAELLGDAAPAGRIARLTRNRRAVGGDEALRRFAEAGPDEARDILLRAPAWTRRDRDRAGGWPPLSEGGSLARIFPRDGPGGEGGADRWPTAWAGWLDAFLDHWLGLGGAPGGYADVLRRAGEMEWFPGTVGQAADGPIDGTESGVAPSDPADAARRDLLARAFSLLEAGRVLGVTHRGPLGVRAANARMARRLRAALTRAGADGAGGAAESGTGRREAAPWFFAGRPLLVTANDYRRELWNGDVGLAWAGADGTPLAAFRRGRGFALWPASGLRAVADGLALTVHKSQGSEYAEVLAGLPEGGGGTRPLVYTALTRARRRAVLFASARALDAALAREDAPGGALDLE